MSTRTKIICTIGPAVSKEEEIASLIQAGMNVARINFGHGEREVQAEQIRVLKKVRDKLQTPLGIMVDVKGPEMRIGKVQEEGIAVNPGDRIPLVKKECLGTKKGLSIRPHLVLDHLKEGTDLLIDNGYILAKVVNVTQDQALLEFQNSGLILSSKGVNIPNVDIPLPVITEKDILDLQVSCQLGIDFVAASFIRTAEHVLAIKKLLHEFASSDVLVIAKIENHQGIQNFDSILQVADGIMVARGDLGVEVPLSEVPKLQKMMIRKCNLVGKPVVTATQMLESMMHNPRPTRAEVSDVANAIYDGTTTVMLSGETAMGNYPSETVRTMKSIIQETEQDFDYKTFFELHSKLRYNDIPSALTLASVKTAYSLSAKAIFTFTQSGTTARLLSRLKPEMPVIAFTSQELTYHQLSLSYGVQPVLCSEPYHSIKEAFCFASQWAVDQGIVSFGDLVVVTTGTPFWVRGTSNTILVESIGDVLVCGSCGTGKRIHGTVSLLATATPLQNDSLKQKIIVLHSFDPSLAPLVHEAKGVLLQNDLDDLQSEKQLLELCRKEHKPAIVRIEGAFRTLKEGQVITMDPGKATVFKGIIS